MNDPNAQAKSNASPAEADWLGAESAPEASEADWLGAAATESASGAEAEVQKKKPIPFRVRAELKTGMCW